MTLFDHAKLAEEAGFDTVWTSDHVHPWWHTDTYCGVAWPWLGPAMERTGPVRFGTDVTPLIARYHPGTIAQAFATPGAMYPSRAFVSTRTGESMNVVPLDYEWPEYWERRNRLIDACEIITRLWDGERLDYDGHYWGRTRPNSTRSPTSASRCSSPETARGRPSSQAATRTAFSPSPTPTPTRTNSFPALEDGAEYADRDPMEITRTRQLLVSYTEGYNDALEFVGFWRGVTAVGFDKEIPDPQDIEEEGREMPLEETADTWVVTTDPADIRVELGSAAAVGFDEVEIHSASPNQRTFVDTMADDVSPHV